MSYDFSGYATKNNLVCADGRIIRRGAFADCNGKKVPLVWNHMHNSPDNVLGHALLESRDDGVYAYCTFNDTEAGQTGKSLVEHGDVTSLSIFANQLKQKGSNVIHGMIREVSLVLAGANPGAYIDSVMEHGVDWSDDETIFSTGDPIILSHSDDDLEDTDESEVSEDNSENDSEEDLSHSATDEKKDDNKETSKDSDDKKDSKEKKEDDETLQDVVDSMTEKQKQVMYALVGMAIEGDKSNDSDDDSKKDDSKEEKEVMKHNAFDTTQETMDGVLMHSDQVEILKLAKSNAVGSLQAAIQQYASSSDHLAHGIDDIETLFPEYRDVRPGAPELITRDQGWVSTVMSKAAKSPISRIRTRQADIRDDTIRAFGYQKGNQKGVPGNTKLLKRTTDPQTVYRKDALNRDDIVDITDFDVVEWQYGIMRMNLNEEIAQAIMIGDGRDEGDENKIFEEHIRPIWTDDDLYTIHADVDIAAAKAELQGTNTSANFGENYIYAEAVITAALYARENYKGSGALDFYCTPHLLNVMLLARDLNGRRIYDSKTDLAHALNVGEIYTAEQFAGKTRTNSDGDERELLGLFVNMKDYQIGCTKGGEITKFNQFDIDFNQEKYLIETRISGALTRVYSAIALEIDPSTDTTSDTTVD